MGISSNSNIIVFAKARHIILVKDSMWLMFYMNDKRLLGVSNSVFEARHTSSTYCILTEC